MPRWATNCSVTNTKKWHFKNKNCLQIVSRDIKTSELKIYVIDAWQTSKLA